MADTTISYSQIRNDFMTKYRKEILPIALKYEAERKMYKRNGRFFTFIFILLALICYSFGLIFEFPECVKELIPTLVGVFLSMAFGSKVFLKKYFENKLKAKIMPIVCSCFDNLHWNEGFYQDSYLILDSNLVSNFNQETYDDIFTGSFKDVNFEIIEAKFKYKDTKDNKITVFQGVIVKLDMNKKFNGHTVIRPNKFAHFSPASHLRHTTLEDVMFEKNFDVYTNDEVEARYLITPSFMERLNNMKTAFKAASVSCAFYENHLFIGLHVIDDLFSIGNLNVPLDDANQYFQMYDEILSIVKLIDHFKLDQKIGL